MRESFSEYKKTLDQVLSNIDYLYSGDVISSFEKDYQEVRKSPLTSPTFIINSIVNIYNESLKNMFDRSSEVVIPKESINDETNLIDLITTKIGYDPGFIFCSDSTKRFFSNSKISKSINSLPSYFYSIDRFVGINLNVYYSPIIKENEGEQIIYATDRSIQSLVYSIQNMDYLIEKVDDDNSNWSHKIVYSFFNCKFKSTKIVIRNVSTIRQSKINEILNGN